MRHPYATPSTARRAALAGVAAAFAGVAVAVSFVAPADAARRNSSSALRIVSPVSGATVSGSARLIATAPRKARTVTFRVDAGRNRATKRRGRTHRDGGVLNTTTLRAGRHTVTVRARVGSKLVVKRVRINVTKSTRGVLRAGGPRDRDKPRTQGALRPVASAPAPTAPTTTPPPPAGGTIFSDDFDGGDLAFSKWDLVQAVSSDRLRVTSAPGGRAGRVARFEVRSGDHVNGEQNSRSELAWGGDMFSEGETHTFSWSSYFTPDFTVENGWATTTQFKGDGTGGPPLELGIIGDEFMLSGGQHVDYAKLFTAPVVRGEWLDYVVRVHWSRDPSKGAVDMWYRGQKVVDNYKMATLLPNRDNYFKFGLYRDPSIRSTGVLFHDGLTISQS